MSIIRIPQTFHEIESRMDTGLEIPRDYVINEEEADTVRVIYAEFQAGLSFTQIAKKLTELGIKSPAGKDVWNSGTVKSILMNEKYKGCALLQKGYTEDCLTKKRVKNDGAVPQYYVEESHPYIIEPEVFDRVQDLIELRKKHKHFSGSIIFSTKIRCGCCGEWFGSKVWHSTDRYRRVIWRCNAKYDSKEHRCSTPQLTEEEINVAFIRAANKLAEDRESLLADLREIQATYSGTDERERRLRELDERLNADVDAVQDLIAQNARVAQNRMTTTGDTTRSSAGTRLPRRSGTLLPLKSGSAASAGGSSSGSSRRWKVCPTW